MIAKYLIIIRDYKNPSRNIQDYHEYGNRRRLEQYVDISKKLEELSEKNGMSFDEICLLYSKAFGNMVYLEEYIQGKSMKLWDTLKDAVSNQTKSAVIYKCLLETKGEKEVAKRKKFYEGIP